MRAEGMQGTYHGAHNIQSAALKQEKRSTRKHERLPTVLGVYWECRGARAQAGSRTR